MLPILLAMLAFGVIHSLLAESSIKQAFGQRIGNYACHGIYRLLYNALAVLTLLPVGAIILLAPGTVVWTAGETLRPVLLIIQAAGLVGLIISLLQIDLGQFIGTSQLRTYLRGQTLPLPTEPLQTGGVYQLVRHPLYLFSLMVIWPLPAMTEAMLGFNIAATIYFTFGSLLEERRLVAIFGQDYITYQQRVPWLIPFIHLRRPGL